MKYTPAEEAKMAMEQALAQFNSNATFEHPVIQEIAELMEGIQAGLRSQYANAKINIYPVFIPEGTKEYKVVLTDGESFEYELFRVAASSSDKSEDVRFLWADGNRYTRRLDDTKGKIIEHFTSECVVSKMHSLLI